MSQLPEADSRTVEGVIAIGGDFTADILLEAYGKGIFPWPQGPVSEEQPILWFSPDSRGVLDFADFHLPRSLEKFYRKLAGSLKITLNQDAPSVMRHCQAQARPGQEGTWILDEMIPAYLELLARGRLLSLEVWRGQEMVGGIYGVLGENYFSGESMFHREPNMSKVALWKLTEHLQTLGQTWMDVQMVTPVLEQFGAKYIRRKDFLRRIGRTSS